MRWVNDGESWSVGDRTLEAICPPLFDSPATRGLWDAKSSVYYSADCFGSLVPSECEELGEIERFSETHGVLVLPSPSRSDRAGSGCR
jgi:flavorubredoxin